jgi:hypothetical protein
MTTPYAGLRDRDYFHIMLNLDAYDDFLPPARALVSPARLAIAYKLPQ